MASRRHQLAWFNGTLWHELHGREDGRSRNYIFMQMGLLALLAVFAAEAASEDGEYRAMPGGLTRAANSRDSLVASMHRGGGSKDTWVLSEGPVSPVTLLRPAGAPVEITRGGAELSSRVADNLVWLGRYVERA